MKKSRLLAVVLSVMFGTISVMAQVEFDVVNDAGIPIRYKVISEANKTVAVTGGAKFYKKVKELSIPESVNYNGATYTVTEIGEKAFGRIFNSKGCNIERVLLPPTIIRIGNQAFATCIYFKSINLPEGLLEIGEFAFYSTGLTCFFTKKDPSKIYIPSSVRVIGKHAFSRTTNWTFGYTTSKTELENLPLFVTTENCEEMGISKESVEKYLAYHPHEAQPQQQIVYVQQAPVQQQPEQQPVVVQEQPKTLSSDVDIDIPQGSGGNDNTFAVIFANENYQEEVNVDYALNDGEMFKIYCQKVLGLPEDNIHIRKDATRNNMISEMSWLQKVADAYKGQARHSC